MSLFSKKKETEEAEEQQPQYYRSPTGETVRNYCVYYLSKMEKIVYSLLAFAVGAAIGYLFYGGIAKDEFGNPTTATHIINIVVMAVCGFAAMKLYVPVRTKQLQQNTQRKLKQQFRDMLEALITSFGAGKNVTDAFINVQEDMTNQYERGAFIIKELAVINNGVINGFTIESLIKDFGARSGIEDISNFADVFEICYRQGGNIKETVRNTCGIIGDKMAIAEDIETTISGSKSEQYIMLIMPIILVGLIKIASPEFASNFTTFSGLIATTVGVVLFVVSYFVGKKLLDIKV